MCNALGLSIRGDETGGYSPAREDQGHTYPAGLTHPGGLRRGGGPRPVPPELATCSHCGAPVEAEYRFCTRCRMPQTPEAAADILERLLVKDLGMNQDDPKVLAAIARVRKEEPALWDGLMQKIAVPVKAFGEDLEEA